MFEPYRKTILKHPKLPLREERKLIALAKKGHATAMQKLMRHLTGFFVYRIQTTLYPWALRECGEDILQECFLLAARKVRTFKLRRRGIRKKRPLVSFSTYLWKAITGLMFSHLKVRQKFCRLEEFSLCAEDSIAELA